MILYYSASQRTNAIKELGQALLPQLIFHSWLVLDMRCYVTDQQEDASLFLSSSQG